MPTENQYYAALDEVQAFADDFNMNIINVLTQEVPTGDEDGENADDQETAEQHYIVLEDSDRTIYVTGQQQWRFFALQYPLNFVDFVAGGLSEEDVEQILNHADEVSEDGEATDREIAAREVIKNTDPNVINSLKNFLNTAAPGGLTEFQTQRTEEIPLTGMSLVGYIFPYDDDFSLRSFADKVMEVLVAGQRASNIVATSTRLSFPDEGESDDYRVEVEPSLA